MTRFSLKQSELIDFFRPTWKEIEVIFKEGKICSERHLQAEFFHILYSNKCFRKKYQIYVEPNITFCDEILNMNKQVIIPDILITEGQNIVAHVELKYVPNGYIEYLKDLRNFKNLYDYRGKDIKILLKTNYLNGEWDKSSPFGFDSEMLIIYGVITNYESDFLTRNQTIWDDVKENIEFVPEHFYMIGSIDKKSEPKFWLANENNIR